MSTSFELDFGGGRFRFHLNDTQMRHIEFGTGEMGRRQPPIMLGTAYQRLLKGRFIVDGKEVPSPAHAEFSVIEMNTIIRGGLLGGGGGVVDGKRIGWAEYDVDSYMKEYVYPMTLVERWELSLAILSAAVEGIAPTLAAA
jgi:hypothetical protein